MNLRGLGSSLGAGGSLIGAALCAAALVGGILAFKGEPGGPPKADTGDLTLPRGEPSVRRASATRHASAAAGDERMAPPDRRAARPRHQAAARRHAPAAPRPVVQAPDPAPAPRSVTPAPAPPPPAGSPDPSPPAATTASGVVQRAVRQTRAAAAPVVEALPAPAQQPVDAAVDAAEQAAGVVDQTLAQVTNGN
jgi:hypothetical protein